MTDIATALAAPFDPAAVSFRVGKTNKEKTKGMALAYIDARDVMNRLDEVCGVFGWQSEHMIVGTRTICRLSLKNPETGEWVHRTDGCGDSDVEPEKGSFSDALKRSAVNFGVGRYLYDLPSPWVTLEQKGSSHIIPETELRRLRGSLPRLGGAHRRSVADHAEPAATEAIRPASTAPAPQPDPFAEQLSEAAEEFVAAVRKQIEAARLPANIEKLMAGYKDSLERLKGDYPNAYADLMAFSNFAKTELLSRAA